MDLYAISNLQFGFLIAGGISLFFSILLFQQEKHKCALGLLLVGAFLLRCYAAFLDPYINMWDERFHALVAKSMMKNPFFPTLFPETPIPYGHDHWTNGYVWLHKQPLFLWQMALSLSVFGTTELGIRFPSMIMTALLCCIIYRIGSILVSKRLGFYGGFLAATSFFITDLVSGRQGMEHNDLAFLFYVSCSIWAWLEYETTKERKWLFLIGLFSGFAILVKWLVGLIVYAGWGLAIWTKEKGITPFSIYCDLLKALGITIAVALPWQVYIFMRFPGLAKKEFDYNSKHLFEVVEKHDGNFWYHFERIEQLYFGDPGGDFWYHFFIWYVLLSFVVLGFTIREKRLKLPVLALPVIIYLFFSITASKLRTYPFVISSIMFIIMGTPLAFAFKKAVKMQWNKYLIFSVELIVLCYLAVQTMQFDKVYSHHFDYAHHESYPVQQSKNRLVYEELKNELPENTILFFKQQDFRHLEIMFYTDILSYDIVPNEEQYLAAKSTGRPIAVISNDKLPDYLMGDPDIIWVDKTIY